MEPSVLILGFGSPLVGDDGAGPRAIALLRSMGLPEFAIAHDGGVSALDALLDIEGKRRVLIVDAVRGGGPPGAIYRVPLAELRATSRPILSLHSLNLLDAVRLWELQLEEMPDVIVFGIEPGNTEAGIGLSPAVENALPELCRLIVAELRADAANR